MHTKICCFFTSVLNKDREKNITAHRFLNLLFFRDIIMIVSTNCNWLIVTPHRVFKVRDFQISNICEYSLHLEVLSPLTPHAYDNYFQKACFRSVLQDYNPVYPLSLLRCSISPWIKTSPQEVQEISTNGNRSVFIIALEQPVRIGKDNPRLQSAVEHQEF